MALKALDYDTLNENVKKCQYAVRGELYLRASELQKEGKKVNTLRCLHVLCLYILVYSIIGVINVSLTLYLTLNMKQGALDRLDLWSFVG
jgi:hypothetical protein